jgi:hypothetical protein
MRRGLRHFVSACSGWVTAFFCGSPTILISNVQEKKNEKDCAWSSRPDRDGYVRLCSRSGCPSLHQGAPDGRDLRLERLLPRRQRRLGIEPQVLGFDIGGPVNPNVAEGCHDTSGGTAGGQIGYRWQAASWVFGLEAQGNWADFKGSNISNQLIARNESKVEAFGLFTGQVGYDWNNALLYVKGGAAVTSE